MGYNRIIGHHKQIEMLKRAISGGKIAHAYLFAGPEGIGKQLVALNFAKTLNCEKDGIEPCDLCPPCKRIESGNFMDVQIFAPKGLTRQLKVEQIEQFISQVNLKPYEGRKKVFILVDADRANISFQNKILKILEEPPQDTVIILVSSSIDSLLPTIRSRCQILNFSALPVEEVEKQLLATGIGSDDARIAAHLSQGQLGNSRQWLEPERAAQRKTLFGIIASAKRLPVEICIAAANELEGYLKKKRDTVIEEELKAAKHESSWVNMDETARARIEEDIKADAEGRFRMEAAGVLNLLVLFYRDMLILKETGREDLILNKDFLKSLKQAAEFRACEEIMLKIKVVESTRESMDRNLKIGSCFEAMLLRLTDMKTAEAIS
jgi:DNA polymerase III subunit delta'